ncbi:MAG: C_GCAxxG_C_C family protein [Mariniphaga sp.]|nr:C_GCAxxG_C_C family protein [Mariniphaga sp.]
MSEKLIQVDEVFPAFNCSQTVIKLFAPEMGLDESTALKIASGFGGGMACAETCGAITGSYMVIGYKHGNDNSDPNAKAHTKSLIKKFNEKFAAEQGSLICKKLIGYDISKPEEAEAAKEAEVFTKKCPEFIKTACKILDEDF